jgi:hypothetical protein
MEYKDSKGNEVKLGDTVLVPCRVVKLVGNAAPLVHLETEEAYGHVNQNIGGPLKGRTKTAIWVEPSQIEVQSK